MAYFKRTRYLKSRDIVLHATCVRAEPMSTEYRPAARFSAVREFWTCRSAIVGVYLYAHGRNASIPVLTCFRGHADPGLSSRNIS
jgi:hypothetical protein